MSYMVALEAKLKVLRPFMEMRC